MWKTPDGVGGPVTPIGPTDTVRLVTNDFMYGGGDGYTVFAGGTDVPQPGDDLLQVTIDYITANSPVDPLVEGRIVGPPASTGLGTGAPSPARDDLAALAPAPSVLRAAGHPRSRLTGAGRSRVATTFTATRPASTMPATSTGSGVRLARRSRPR